ncbi:MAG: hydantoinase/oxoprolinase family protein [Chitinophagaceae bacterium]|nr:hydantoinase/oxoprolinase family protein [Chitinophagaceae bacterium]
MNPKLILGIDVGGTFTDLALLFAESGRLILGKTLTTYPDPTPGIFSGINDLLQKAGISISEPEGIIHGTTLVTNAVIERKGEKTGLITTKGFEDILEIGREIRYDIYDLFISMPQPLVPTSKRFGITERINAKGEVITAPDLDEIRKIITELETEGVRSVAVVLLHSYLNPSHEKQIGNFIRRNYPHLYCSLSCEIIPEIREYERSSATVMNAYVQPVADMYLNNLSENLKSSGFKGFFQVMNSSGRLITAEQASKKPIDLLESGPAGGCMAGVYFSKKLSIPDLLAFDMGGTTAKASLIRESEPQITYQFEAAREKRFKKGSGLPVRIPVIDLIEIGAGGGSVARVNELGLLTVGPDSASSQPGPACYGNGGIYPTVTDADLVLGYLNESYFLGGKMKLCKEKAAEAIESFIAKPLGISVEKAAWGIHRVVNENMANAARVHIIEKGLNPKHFKMIAFGGAGPVHAYHVARLLHAPGLIIPGAAGVLSAFGFLVSQPAIEFTYSKVQKIDCLDFNDLNETFEKFKKEGMAYLLGAGADEKYLHFKISCEMRYAGQGHEIHVPMPLPPYHNKTGDDIKMLFENQYQQKFGRIMQGHNIETVTWRVLISGNPFFQQTARVVVEDGGAVLKGYRMAYFKGQYINTPVYNRYALSANTILKGPCIIEEHESTVVVGCEGEVFVDEANILHIQFVKNDEPVNS